MARLQARLRNRAEAEDVTSETFVRVLAYRRLSAMQEPRAYLSTVAKSVLVQTWRRRDLERACIEALGTTADAFSPSPQERAELLQLLERIADALDGLSVRARTAFLMSQLDGQTYAEIAAQLGVSVSRVRQYMAQGLRRCLLATAPFAGPGPVQ